MPALPASEAFGPAPSFKTQFLSPDGRWRWTGTQWVPTRPLKPPMPMRTKVFGILWLLSLSLWLPIALAVIHSDSPGWNALSVSLVAALALPIPTTMAWGAHLGRTSRWRVATLSVPVGCFVLMFAYGLAFVLGPDADADIEAGAGIGMFSVPTLLALAVLVYAGSGIGVAWRRARGRYLR